MPDRQPIVVVRTPVDETELARVQDGLGRDPVLITAPTADAAQVGRILDVEPQVEPLLAPVSFPAADRGHQLDALVRRHALRDRYRGVVVVADPATSTLLLRALAPGQLPSGGAVTVVGLPRGDRPVAVRRGVAAGVVLGGLAYLAGPILALPVAVALVGCALSLWPRSRHLGRELLLAAGIGLTVALAVVAGSARFPDGW